jgi:NADH-quinone oxidoreductase subunit M
MSPLTYILGWPLLVAVALLLVPRNFRVLLRIGGVLGTFVPLLLTIGLFFKFQSGEEGFQFVQKIPWVVSLGISYHVGVDGLNVGLILMAAIVAFAASCVSWEIKHHEKEFYALFLLMTAGVFGAFASLDLFFFYFFHELALIPTFIMIGVWGRGEDRNYATFHITLYLSVGALILLVGLIALYLQAGIDSFDIIALTNHFKSNPLPARSQHLIFPLLLFGFGILVSLWPFHTWAPLGYAAAPSPTAMLHAGVLKKFGLYGLIRIAIPLLPEATQSWLPVIAWLCLGNIVLVGFVAMRQRDLNLLIGNSSVAHMGFAFLGIASFSLIGFTGAVLVMIAHGLLAALSFGLSGYLYSQTGTLDFDRLTGLLRKLPFVGTVFIMAMLAGCGLPGFANFFGEVLVLFGSWSSLPGFVVAAAWGALIIGAVYMLRAIRKVFHGPLADGWENVVDASNWWRRLPYALLLSTLILFGCLPRLLTDKIEPSIRTVLSLALQSGPSDSTAMATARSEP